MDSNNDKKATEKITRNFIDFSLLKKNDLLKLISFSFNLNSSLCQIKNTIRVMISCRKEAITKINISYLLKKPPTVALNICSKFVIKDIKKRITLAAISTSIILLMRTRGLWRMIVTLLITLEIMAPRCPRRIL